MYKKTSFILVLVMLLLVSNLTYAEGTREDLGSLRNAINNNSGVNYLKGQEKEELMSIIRDILNIVRVIVITYLFVKLFKLFVYFKLAYDSPTVKSVIRIKALGISVGIIFTVNFWNIIRLMQDILTNLKIL